MTREPARSAVPPVDPVDEVLSRVSPHSPTGTLLLATLQDGWSAHGLPAAELPELLATIHRAGSSDAALVAATMALPALRQESAFATAYRAARAAKFECFAELLAPWLQPGSVLDVGAGDRQLLQRLHARVVGGSWLATDVHGSPTPADATGVAFVRQARPDAVPVPTASVTSAIATGMLHHMPPDLRGRLLADLSRALAPGGRLLIIEDTHPTGSWASVDLRDAEFQSLTASQQRDLLVWTDWWGNRLLKDLPDEPLPCTFDTMTGWSRRLSNGGLELIHSEYLGLVHLGGHMATPRALFVLERRP